MGESRAWGREGGKARPEVREEGCSCVERECLCVKEGTA